MKSARQMSFFNKQDTAAKPSALKFFVDMGTVGYSKRYYMKHIHEQNKTSLANTK